MRYISLVTIFGSCNLLWLLLTIACKAEVDPSYEKETTITAKEAAALEKFKKSKVVANIPASSYVSKFTKDDLYLIRWLRAANLNVHRAETIFSEHLKWREDEKMDEIDKEDFSDVRGYPVYNFGFDKFGQPITEFWVPEWNTKRAILQGKFRRVVRRAVRSFELAHRRLYNGRAEGKEIANARMLADVENFSVIYQGCPICLPVYYTSTLLMEKHYPFLYGNVEIINVPLVFRPVLLGIYALTRVKTRRAINSYVSKSEWIQHFAKIMDKDQRSVRFAGTVTKNDLEFCGC